MGNFDFSFLKCISLLTVSSLFQDLCGNVRRISDFLGKHFSEDMIAKITHQCTFGEMKKNAVNFTIENAPSKPSLLRKGKVGDWRNYFSEELNRKFDEQLLSKLDGTGLTFDFGEQSK